jgi:hypothetical protein
MNKYSRRKFIKISGCTIASGGLILLSPPAEAIWPWILRFIFSAGVRTGARSIVRKGTVNTLRGFASRRSFKSTVNLGLTASLGFSVSPNVYAKAKEYDAEAIWINSGYSNNFQLALQNDSSERKQAQLSYLLRDVPSDKVVLERNCGVLSAGPNDSFGFSFEISELPFVGVKRLEAVSDNPELYKVPSGNIVIANSNEVSFDEG